MEQVNFHFELDERQRQLKEETYQKLLKDSHVQRFMKEKNIDSAYIFQHCGKISDWSMQVSKCDNCKGLDFCRQPMRGHVINLEVEGFLHEVVHKCKYQKAYDESVKHRSYYRIMDMNEAYLLVDISKLDLSKESVEYKKVIMQCLKLMNDSEEKKGLFLCGRPGVGKSYLAAGLLNHYAKHHTSVAFVNVPKMLSDLKLLFSDSRMMEQTLQRIRNVEVLVLDDIGGESVTAWSRDEILLPILDKRMEKKKCTLFTSNYKMEELRQRLSVTSNKSQEPMAAERVMDRIKALSNEVFVKGASRR